MPPRTREPISSEATTVKAVSSDGNARLNVSVPCSSFQICGMPGSVYWWWKPTGTESNRKSQKTSRARFSLNILPDVCAGNMPYQARYAGSSQK